MTIQMARNIWQNLPSLQNIEAVSSNANNDSKELVALNTQLRGLITTIIDEGNNNSIEELAQINKLASKLFTIIPDLNGEEQVYYAKLYRVCHLLTHPDSL